MQSNSKTRSNRRSLSQGSMLLLSLCLAACASPKGAPSAAGGPGASSSPIPYPFDTCLVTDNKLGTMGDPVRLVYEGHELYFCCAPCLEEFRADPQQYLKRLE